MNPSSSVDAISGGIVAAVLALTSSQVATRSSQFLQGHAADLQALAFQAGEWHQDMQLVAIYLDAMSGCNVPPDLRSRPLAWRTHLATRTGALVSGPVVLAAGTIGPLAAAVGSVGPRAASVAGFYETAYSFTQAIEQEEVSYKKLTIKILCGSLRGACLGLGVGGMSPDRKVAGCAAGAMVGSVVGALGAAVGSVSGMALKRLAEAAGCQNRDFKAMSTGAIAAAVVAGPILGFSLPFTIGAGMLAAGLSSIGQNT